MHLYVVHCENDEKFLLKLGCPRYVIQLYDDDTDEEQLIPIEVIVGYRCKQFAHMPRLIKCISYAPFPIWCFVYLHENLICAKNASNVNKWKFAVQTLQCIHQCFSVGVYHTALDLSKIYLTTDGDVRIMGWHDRVYIDDKLIESGPYRINPPELMFKTTMTDRFGDAESVIMWLYGCVLYELYLGETLQIDLPSFVCLYLLEDVNKGIAWMDNSDVCMHVQNMHTKISLKIKHLPYLERQIIHHCLQACPRQRLTILECKSMLFSSKNFIFKNNDGSLFR